MLSSSTIFIHDGCGVPQRLLQTWISEVSRSRCRTQSWDDFEPSLLKKLAVDLIIPIASRNEPRATHLFTWLRSNPVAAAVLAVFQEGVPEDTLRQALDVVDELVFWPVARSELIARVRRILGGQPGEARSERQLVRSRLMEDYSRQQLIGEDPAFCRVAEALPRMASVDLPVLITGETGTGKEIVARTIHHLSLRQKGSFIPVDCPTLPDQLFENELFGHVKGAYTDASRDQRGLVALADSGTLFLDEVNTLPLSAQAKLLRFLQERTYRRLGEDRFQQADVRVLAASNSSLEELVEKTKFRADLFYRLSVLRLHIPPLRERPDDIPLLALHCLQNHCPRSPGRESFISPAGLRKLSNHHWPGNVRELFSVVQRAWVVCAGRRILPCHILFSNEGALDSYAEEPALEGFAEAKARTVEAFERGYVERMLRRHDGNITRAAAAAGKERRSFGRLVKKYGITP